MADVRPQSPIPHPLDDLAQLGAIGLDDEVDGQAALGWGVRRSDDGYQGSSGSYEPRGPRLDVAADDIEHQIDGAIRVRSVDDTYDPYLHRHVLAVSEADAARAVDIRRRIERQDAADAPRHPPLRKSVVAGIVAFWIVVYLLLRWFATH